MSLIVLLFWIVVIGVICYGVENFVPMSPVFKFIFRAVVALALLAFVLTALGVPLGFTLAGLH